MYMIDYLENICAFRLKKQRQTEKDEIRVIASEGSPKSVFQTAPQSEEGECAGNSRQNRRSCPSILRENREMSVREKPRDRLSEGQ